ncbi:MAG: tetratricopeptide repeat protein [Acidobacteriaceae bacterium]|nr:tetratricopeptide repeat protein [Acidobacteriaceae bacterium]MBV9780371.1 tetratricopeptide repeat protein [Acidobacteriaceae bacterium]
MLFRALLIIVCLQISVLWTVASPQEKPVNGETAQSYIAQARKALRAGYTDEGEHLLKLAIQADPSCADAYLLLGSSEFRRGDISRSIEHFDRAVKLRPELYSAHYNLALAYLRANKLTDARAELEQAVTLDPQQPDAVYNLGIVLLDLGETRAAIRQLKRASDLNPHSPDVAFNLLRAELTDGQLQEAHTEAQRAAVNLASDAQWNAAVGGLFLNHADPTTAALYFREAYRLRPDDTRVRNQLALAYLQAHQPEAVFNTINPATTADDHYLRASAYYLLHQFSEADEESAIAFHLAPNVPSIQLLRAHILQRSGKQESALKLLGQTIRMKPDWDEPYYSAGVSYYFLGRYNEARESLRRALELNPSSVKGLFLMATTIAHQGAAADAEPYFHRAVVLQPSNARLHCHLGLVFLQENENAKAEECFRRAIELKPDYALPHYELGKLLMHSNEFPEAARELEAAIIHDPSLTSAYYQLSRVYSRLGEAKKSELVLARFKELHKQEDDTQTVHEDVVKQVVSD